jgi:hypothetical protein
MSARIGQIDALADQADREMPHAPALADARVEDRGLVARIGADDQRGVRLLDAGDGRVEDIERAAPARVDH